MKDDLGYTIRCDRCDSENVKSIPHMSKEVDYNSLDGFGVRIIQVYQCKDCRSVFAGDQ